MIAQVPALPTRFCQPHRKPISGICRSPHCEHYRELCGTCHLEHGHAEYQPWEEAVREAKELAQNGLRSLQATRARKNAEMDNYMRNNMAIVEIEAKLGEISQLLQEKIEDFKQNINRIYSEHVKEKLEDLDQIIAKSEKILKDQLLRLERHPHDSLAPLLTRDLLYELKYYDSYFNEIFIKKTRHFRTALQNDRIFTLIVNFQQNLQKIFTFNLEPSAPDHRQYHLFRQQSATSALYTLSKDASKIQKKTLPSHIGDLVSLPENYEYKWMGVPQSIFYKPNNCYYIFGEASKTSRLIVKWEWAKGIDDGFCAVRTMDTERREFSVCELGGEIYIIGGENQREGCLSRCEKFVPLCGSQIYIIHSLNSRSSRHSLITYKDKYILKFGGIRKLLADNIDHKNTSINFEELAAPAEIYSIQTQQWSIIPIRRDIIARFQFYPTIFSMQSKAAVLVLGGDSEQNRNAFEIGLEESKGTITQVKVKSHKCKLKQRSKIFNSTIRVEEEENTCVFISGQDDLTLTLDHIKLHN